jgi:DNA modification methylase
MSCLGPYLTGPNETPENGIYIGDARILAEALPDESVDLIFTDPIYSNIEDYRWLAETAARVLKPGKSLLAMAGNLEKPRIYEAMSTRGLTYFWEAAILYRGANFFMNSKAIQVSWKPLLWYAKGRREMAWCKDALVDTRYEKQHHRFQQSPTAALWFVRQLTRPGDIVFDPFCGWGAFQKACKILERRWLAFEIDPDTAELARQRVAQTQPPLPGLAVNQLRLGLDGDGTAGTWT